jgi:hypothetical protein
MNSLNQNVQGQVVVLKADVFRTENRALAFRVWKVLSGFGAAAITNGRALFCESLLNGDKVRFDGMAIERIATANDLAVVEQYKASS